MHGAKLKGAKLSQVILKGADLHGADFEGAELAAVDLSQANLQGTNLRRTRIYDCEFVGADFTASVFGQTLINNADLRLAKGLQGVIQKDWPSLELRGVVHRGPSSIGIDTVYRSRGHIPREFLRGCGVPDSFIDYIASLTSDAIEYHSCFISYASTDEDFAVRLHADLQHHGVRCWFAPTDMRTGDKIRSAIDQSIRMHDKVLLILSKNSINSQWVEKEVETAFEQEHQRGETVFFPIRLDSTVMETRQAWAADIRRTRHIGDFANWKDHDTYRKSFERLLRDLKAEIKCS